MSILDNLPVASIVFVVGTILAVIAYLTGDLSIEEAFEAIGYAGVGAGVVGVARNGAGRGVKS